MGALADVAGEPMTCKHGKLGRERSDFPREGRPASVQADGMRMSPSDVCHVLARHSARNHTHRPAQALLDERNEKVDWLRGPIGAGRDR